MTPSLTPRIPLVQIVLTNDWHTLLHETAVAACDAFEITSSTCAIAGVVRAHGGQRIAAKEQRRSSTHG